MPSRQVGLTIKGTIGDHIGEAIGGLQLIHMEPNRLANALGITGVATAWWHQEGDTRLVLDHQPLHDLIEVRPMIPAIPASDVHDLCSGVLVTVVASMAKAMLKLRATYLSGDFDAYWAFHVAREHERLHPPGYW